VQSELAYTLGSGDRIRLDILDQDTVVQEGDTIFVPTAVNPAQATELATASFLPDTIQVSVVGEVTEPGVVEVSPNPPLTQALLAAGGVEQEMNFSMMKIPSLSPQKLMQLLKACNVGRNHRRTHTPSANRL
jgi:polysaccharide export outer membrane protein